jgi:hypothetical protein
VSDKQYTVRRVGEGEDWETVMSEDPETAAAQFAEETNDAFAGECSEELIREGWEVEVKSQDGLVSKYRVRAEASLDYYAHEIAGEVKP